MIKEKSQKSEQIKNALEAVKGRGVPKWLELDAEKFSGKVVAMPTREDVALPINEQLIVELYSK